MVQGLFDIIFLVQEELTWRRPVHSTENGKRRCYSCNHCFAQLVFSGDCCEFFRRVHWNNRGCKTIVWRCCSRLEATGYVCHARTVNEEYLQEVVIQAINQVLCKKEYVNTKTGETIDSSDVKGFVDFDKVAEYKKSLGYYQIVTSELTMAAQDIIDKYHGLTQIEDQFRVMKGDLETRPLYVRTPEHIKAHLVICMIALVLMRIIQKRIRDSQGTKRDDVYWNVGMSGERIQKALNKWKVEMLVDDLYRFTDVDDPDLASILQAFNIAIPAKLFRRAELKSIKSGTQIFM